jgi:hypothetical protein
MDDDADRNPEQPGSIRERRKRRAELDRAYRERRRELEKEAEADPWDYLPETHDDLYNEADYEIPPLWETIQKKAEGINRLSTREYDDRLAAAIGKTTLVPFYCTPSDHADICRNLDGVEVIRLYLFMDLSPKPEYRIADQLKYEDTREELRLSDTVSQSTINRIPGRLGDRPRNYYASETETLVRQWEDTKYESLVREPTPDTIAPDGKGIPPVQTLARELRGETFKYIRMKRDSSTEVSKDAAMRVLVAAANGNEFVNDAAQNLDLKPWYDGNEVPTGQTLLYHIQKSNREQITRMFMEANEPLFEEADDCEYFPEKAEVAIDITDWPYFGDSDRDEYIRGTKSGRNFSQAWKYITLSLVGTDTPLVLLVLPVKSRSNAPQYVRRLLRLSSQYLNLHRVYLDAGSEFYSEDTISTVSEFDLELVMQGRKAGGEVKHFLDGMARCNLDSTYYPYGIGDLDEDEYYAVGVESEKRSKRRKSDPDEPMDDYTYLYTNVDPSEVPPEELAEDFRNRWGIETGFRVIKEEFLPKSASPDSVIRTFYFNFAAHMYNIWTVANIRRADEIGADLSKGKQFTAGRLMQAIEDDQYDLDIPTEPAETRNVFGTLF